MSATEVRPAAAAGVFHEFLPLDTIEPSKTNPRKHFNPSGLEELCASIKEKGVVQPIVVRRHPRKSSKMAWEIVAGERRYRASKMAGMGGIPAIARELDDIAVLEIQVIENGQREDVHELEEAHGYKALIDSAGYDAKTIAEKVSKSPEYVYGRLKLLNLIQPLQGKFLDGTITAGHAILFARLPEDSQIAAAKRLFETDHPRNGKRQEYVISVRELANWIQSEIQMDLSKALFDVTDPRLVPAAGACGGCRKRTGAEPELWPEVKKGDFCTDNACFQKKTNAAITAKVESGEAVRLTDDYSSQKKAGVFYTGNIREIRPGTKSCEFATTGIIVDGYHRGTTKRICSNEKCKVHYSTGGGYRSERNISTPTQQFENAKTAIALQTQSELNHRIYDAALAKLTVLDADVKQVLKKPALMMILRLVFQRLDSSVRNRILEEMKLSKQDLYGNSAVEKMAVKLDVNRLMVLIVRLGLKNLSMGFTGAWGSDPKKAGTELLDIAEGFGVKVAPIQKDIDALKAEKLKKAKARMDAAKKSRGTKKPQASAKRKSKTAGVDTDPGAGNSDDADGAGGDDVMEDD